MEESTSPPRRSGRSLTDTPHQPVWQRRWFQWLMGLLVGLVVISFILPPLFAVVYEVRAILVPVLIAFGLAYVVNPVISHAHRRYRLPRWAGTTGILSLGALVVLLFLLLVVPPVIAQGAELFDKLRNTYPQKVVDWLRESESAQSVPGQSAPPAEIEADPADETQGERAASPVMEENLPQSPAAENPSEELDAESGGLFSGLGMRIRDPAQWRSAIRAMLERLRNLEWSQISGVIGASLDVGVGMIGTAIGFTTYLMLAVVIAVFCFFFFAWRFDRIADWFVDFIPLTKRVQTLRLIEQMDRTISAFIRGRLIQAAVMGVILSVGWFIVGVPYWLLLGVLSGMMNLVPFIAVVGWMLAALLTLADHAAGPHGLTLWTLLGPTLVYMLAQGVDGWVVEPIVQGQATNLDPITVLLVVMIGGAIAGLLGMLIAIPTAACVKILAKEVVLPKLRTLAAEN